MKMRQQQCIDPSDRNVELRQADGRATASIDEQFASAGLALHRTR
jgi:hypothetical protein